MMLKPSEINYFDHDTISAYSGKGWRVFDENVMACLLITSFEEVQEALEKARIAKDTK
ncbi:MAG: hypothetical protein HUJ97_00270 [Bacteroidales bacterium]|nr:hypothetical protein [Bacteroidales bacterium]